jgi:hypothetical protein
MRKSVILSIISLLAFGLVTATAVSAAPGSFDIKKIPTEFKYWSGSYNEALESWTFQKYTAAADGTDQISTFYIDNVSDGNPGSFNDYTKNLKKKDWLDLLSVWTVISTSEKLPDGFLFTGMCLQYKDPTAKPTPSFVLVKKFKNATIRCKGDAGDAALLAEAVEFCQKLK